MKMPSGLVIQDPKLTRYLLVYQIKDDKSEFLARAGYTLETWQDLRQDILRAIEGATVSEVVLTEWGSRYLVEGLLAGLNSYRLNVITIWQQDRGSDLIRFVTLYPDKSKVNGFEQEL